MLWDWLNARRIVCGDGAWILLKPAILPWKSGYWFENDSRISFLATRCYTRVEVWIFARNVAASELSISPIDETTILAESSLTGKFWQKLAKIVFQRLNDIIPTARLTNWQNIYSHSCVCVFFFLGSPLVRNISLNFPTRRRDASRTRCLASGQFLHEMCLTTSRHTSPKETRSWPPPFFSFVDANCVSNLWHRLRVCRAP